MITPEHAVDAINERFGRHPGRRALHAKGTFCKGSFTATPEATRLTHAAHMRGEPVAVTARVSNGSGDPRSLDYEPDVRGMAVTFHLPGGARTDIVAQTAPRFPVSTAEEFIKFLSAGKPGAAKLWKLPLFFATHRAALAGLPENAPSLKPPASYATCRYYAIHAFKWIDEGGGERYVRYTWIPDASAASLSKAQAKQRGPDYLQDEIRERLERGPARFALQLQLAEDGDPVEDPAAVWPEERETVLAGTLELTGLDATAEADGAPFVFDPVRTTDGIDLSDDPVLRFRPRAYSVSAERRSATGGHADSDAPTQGSRP